MRCLLKFIALKLKNNLKLLYKRIWNVYRDLHVNKLCLYTFISVFNEVKITRELHCIIQYACVLCHSCISKCLIVPRRPNTIKNFREMSLILLCNASIYIFIAFIYISNTFIHISNGSFYIYIFINISNTLSHFYNVYLHLQCFIYISNVSISNSLSILHMRECIAWRGILLFTFCWYIILYIYREESKSMKFHHYCKKFRAMYIKWENDRKRVLNGRFPSFSSASATTPTIRVIGQNIIFTASKLILNISKAHNGINPQLRFNVLCRG